MKPALIDTGILSLFFRNDRNVVIHFNSYLNEYDSINFSIISYYEILSGLLYKDARKQLEKFLEFSKENRIILLSVQATKLAAEWQARLRSEGQIIGHTDTLIAGIAIANDFQLITNNTEHFRRIEGLEIANRSESPSVK